MTYKEQISAVRFIASAFKSYRIGGELPEKSGDLTWEMVYAMAKSHSLLSLAFAVFGESIKSEAPELYQKWAKKSYIKSACHIAQKKEFDNLTSLFSENKIHFLPLKGFLIKRLYPSEELREMSDLDILVTGGDFMRASDIILSEGYTKGESCTVHDSFSKPPFLEIELHRILHSELPDFKAKDAPAKENNPYWHMLSDEDFFLFMLNHGKKHNESGGCGARAVFDFYLLKEHGKASLCEDKMKEAGVFEFYKSLEKLSALWFSGEEPDSETVDFELHTVMGGTYGSLQNEMSDGMKKSGKKYVFSRIFPPYKHMKARYPFLKWIPILLPVMYIWRLIASLFNGRIKEHTKALSDNRKNEKAIAEYKREQNAK